MSPGNLEAIWKQLAAFQGGNERSSESSMSVILSTKSGFCVGSAETGVPLRKGA